LWVSARRWYAIRTQQKIWRKTLFEAWKHRHDLRESDKAAQWLSGIARNICLRWKQHERRDAAHRIKSAQVLDYSADASYPDSYPAGDSLDVVADDFDLELELEHHELGTLLDQAMAWLPSDARAILIGRYIERLAHAELAQRLGISEGTVKVRLHRGKLALRRVLLSEFAESARSYGLMPPASETWEETRLWCTLCGQHRLLGRLTRQDGQGEFALRCPGCFRTKGLVYHHSDASLLVGVTRYKPAMARVARWAERYFREALERRIVPCRVCGHPAPLSINQGSDALATPDPLVELRTLRVTCAHCGCVNLQSHVGLVLASAQGQAFWRLHPRIRLVPERAVEAQGRPALVTGFASVTDGARLDVVSARDTYEVLAVSCAISSLATPVSPVGLN
jgi:RNA polymerase sigma factor (sigma-70 family)